MIPTLAIAACIFYNKDLETNLYFPFPISHFLFPRSPFCTDPARTYCMHTLQIITYKSDSCIHPEEVRHSCTFAESKWM